MPSGPSTTYRVVRVVRNLIKKNQTSDISQDFRLADILGVPQAIKGFDKSDFCEVFFNLSVLQGGNYD